MVVFLFSVTSVHGFTDENNGLSIITSNTRYVIPQHIKELMTSLYRWDLYFCT